MLKNNYKHFKKIFLIWLFLALSIGFSLGFKFYTTFNKPKIDEQAYNDYAHSIIYHHDLNNYRLVDNFVSNTKNKIDFYSWGSGMFLIPFHLYAGILNEIRLDITTCYWEFNIAATLGSIIFFLIFIYFTQEICQKLNLHLHQKDLLIFLIGTPVIWYAFFETDTSQIFFLAYIAFAINLVLELENFTDRLSYLKLIVVGAVFGFSYVIDPVGILYFFGFLVYLIVVLKEKNSIYKISIFYLLGGLAIILMDFANVQLKFGQIITFLFFVQKDYFGFISKKFLMASYFFGPQGMLYLSPIYILSAFGIYSYFDTLTLNKNKDLRLPLMTCILGVIFVISVFLKNYYWSPTSIVYGKYILEHQLLFILGFSFFITNKSFSKKFLVCIFIVWNLLWLARYFSDKSNFGMFYELPNFDFFRLILEHFYDAMVVSIKNLPSFMAYFTLWILLIAVLYYSFCNIFFEKRFWKLSYLVILLFLMITISNIAFNSFNAKNIVSVTTIKDPDMYFLPSFLQELKMRKAISDANGRAEVSDIFEFKIKETENILKQVLPSLSPRKEFDDASCGKDWM